MNVRELIERLEEAAEMHGEETEVRLMTQQNWPFENAVAGVTASDKLRDPDDDEDFHPEGDDDAVVYIVEGRQLGYGTARAWEVCH